MVYLLDTCIWRDFYENRFSKSGNPLGKYAADLFIAIIKKKEKILYSEALIWEMKKDYAEKDVFDMLNVLIGCKVLVKIEITQKQFEEGKRLSVERNIPFIDCLNAMHARDHNAVMVSQDTHYFEELSDISKSVRPQNIN